MKRFGYYLISLFALFNGFQSFSSFAQNAPTSTGEWCELGLLYQISYQNNWGDSYAVVADVVPGSPAHLQGVIVGDVIKTIDGKSTREMSDESITQALSNPSSGFLTLGLARFNKPDFQVTIQKVCHPSGALDEKLIARAFNMYSLEDVVDRTFTLPLKVSIPTDTDFMQYKSFSFDKGSSESSVSRAIAKELKAKGLKEMTKGGDLLVQYQGSFGQNESFRAGSDANMNPDFKNYRYDSRYEEIRKFPFLSLNTPAFSAQNQLTVSISLIDAKNGKEVWGVSAKELLNETYVPEDYVAAFAPMMFANFPFTRYLMNPSFISHDHTFRFTGISYDAEDLQIVKEVKKGSPADKAGIQPGDRIVAINGLQLVSSMDDATEDYRDFLADSWGLRDKSTIFPSSGGFRSSMYWTVDKYAEVATLVQEPKYHSAFAYLFSHRPYISAQTINELVFDIERNGKSISILVRPQLLNLGYIEIK